MLDFYIEFRVRQIGTLAAANGIVPPYLQEGFSPAPVWPTKREREAAPSTSAEPPDELQLPPLQGGMHDEGGGESGGESDDDDMDLM